jgi:excisionase family DNA binding protein
MKTNNKRDNPKTQKQEAKQEARQRRAKPKPKRQEKQEERPKEAAKGRTQTATTQLPTHYEPSGSIPGLQFADSKRQEGSGVIVLATPAVPPAADCGTASPCGDRLYGGPARGLTFGLCRTRGSKGAHLAPGGMRRNQPTDSGPTFFTERSLAAYLAVSDRTIRNWIRRGELPSYKLGASRRIDPADVDAFLAQRRDEPA